MTIMYKRKVTDFSRKETNVSPTFSQNAGVLTKFRENNTVFIRISFSMSVYYTKINRASHCRMEMTCPIVWRYLLRLN